MSLSLKKVKGTLERVLDKNLQDLVRGIRNHKENEAKYIAECLDEIKHELRQDNIAVKANAVQKLNYLQMIGYDISWAAFNIIEVMSSTKFTWKRIGYLTASQSFHEGTDVLMLTTNMIRKDLSSGNMYDAGVALCGLACFITPDLSRDLANDIMTLMSSTKPYLRKKAVLIMYKVFLKFPEALRPAFPRLKEKLEDPDPGVQSAAVNVICELARKNPKNYLSLAPMFFKLMTSSTNNWVLIKIIKLFGALTPLEPRLGKKLIEPLTNLIHSTSAMSLLYECINTVIAGIPNHSASIQLCVQKLRILIEDSDQNLKYLGLLAMSRILKTHPKSVQAHKDLILQCLDDKDESIRLRALDLLYGMVTKKNLMEVVKKLMVHMDKAEGSHYRDELLSKTIEISCQSNYQYITNFEWYVSVLVELTRMEGTRHGRLIASQMLDVAIRVQAIRPFAVGQMAVLLENACVFANNAQRNGIAEVLYAAAWICGEFSEHLADPKSTLESMLRSKVTSLPGHIQSIYVQNVMKLYSRILNQAEEEEDAELTREVTQLLTDKLPMFVQSADLEVQDRACCALQLMKYITKLQDKGVKCAEEVGALFAGDLNPVAAKAQKKVPVPEGLDLDKWINEPPSESSDEDLPVRGNLFTTVEDHRSNYQSESRKKYELTEEELEQQREQRMMEQASNPFYIKGSSKKKNDLRQVEEIPVAEIDLSVPLHVPGMSSSDKYLQLQKQEMKERASKKSKSKKKKRKKRGHVESESEEEESLHQVSTTMDMPEGINLSDQEDTHGNEEYSALDINLDEPLRDEEYIAVPKHREVLETNPVEEVVKVKKKHRHKSSEKKEKKEKKGKKKKSKTPVANHEEDTPALLETYVTDSPARSDTPTLTPQLSPEKKPAATNSTPGTDDLDFWLSGNNTSTPSSEPAVTQEVPVSEEPQDEKPKKKKEKKVKKEKKSKKKKSGYEEAEGMSTPSKENNVDSNPAADLMSQLPALSSYKLLGENKSLKMVYETRVSPQQTNSVVSSVIFTNLTEFQIKDLEFNVMDSMNTKLVRGFGASQHDPVKVPFILLPNAQNEGQFAFQLQNINMAQKLKGTLTYIVKTEEGSTYDKIDFRLSFPVSSYLLAVPCKSPHFAEVLGSGELEEKYSTKFNTTDSEFSHVLAKICFFNHFSIVEQVDQNASLYAQSIQGHKICLLVKQLANNGLSLDGKSTDLNLLSNIIDDIKTVLTESS